MFVQYFTDTNVLYVPVVVSSLFTLFTPCNASIFLFHWGAYSHAIA